MMDIETIIKRQNAAASDRSQLESVWEEVLSLYSPMNNVIYDDRSNFQSGMKKDLKQYDSAPENAAYKFATIVDGYLTPRDKKWHRLRCGNNDLMKIGRVARWFDDATDVLFKLRYSSQSNFAAQNNEALHLLGVLGNGPIFVDEFLGRGIRYKSEHLYDTYLFENDMGIVDTVHYLTAFEARQYKMKFSKDGDHIPDNVESDAKDNPGRKYDVLHVTMPNKEYEKGAFGYRGMAYASLYIDMKEKSLIRKEGYRKFPWVIYRDATGPREVYASSPALRSRSDTKMLMQMEKSGIRLLQKMADPPLLTSDARSFGKIQSRPGSITHGGIDSQGRQLVQYMKIDGRPDLIEAKSEQKRNAINESFLVHILRMSQEHPEATATEILNFAEERGIVLTPLLGRLQSEGLGVLIDRELDVAGKIGALPPMPPELIEAQGEYVVQYDSPLSRAQKAEEALGIQRQFQWEASLAEVMPMLEQSYNMNEARRIMAGANAVPARVTLDEDEINANKAAAAQAAGMAQMAQAAPGVGKAIESVAKAGKITQEAASV